MQELKIGLVPFYLKLYDDSQPTAREGFDAFITRIEAGFSQRGVAVATAPICRIASEFDAAVQQFERDGVTALVTVHLAYSPSLEAVDAFARTSLPLILFDTTMDAAFGPETSPTRIRYNHGIHGVMDFACMLRRRKRHFEIVAGHDADPALFDRAAGLVRAASAAAGMRGSRALRVGKAFEGMGDFAVEEPLLQSRFGIAVEQVGLDALDDAIAAVDDTAIAAELADDRERYDCDLPEETHRLGVTVGLGLRRMLASGGYGAMSVNFQAFDRKDRPACMMPFLEISKSMSRGIGYGGEGDVLTASMVGALARAFTRVTFTEIFCPDWNGGRLFLSHMGEVSPAVAGGRGRIFEKRFPFGGSLNPAALVCPVLPGPATLVNLAPGPDDSFRLIVAPVAVDPEDGLHPELRDAIRAWVRPTLPVAAFLEAYSRAGGTHHSALVLGDCAEALEAFGRFLGLDVTCIGQCASSGA